MKKDWAVKMAIFNIFITSCFQLTVHSIERPKVTTLALDNPENRTVQKSKCAKSSSEGFIVGGTKTEHGEFPHMAAIGWQLDEKSQINWNCGGSLIRFVKVSHPLPPHIFQELVWFK